MASRGINKVIIVGNLGQDPEVRYTPNGKAIANLSIATSESWKDQQGQMQERTEWHRVAMFGKLAEVAGEYLRKGSQVYIEGKLQTRKWQDQNGQDKYTTEVVVDGFDGKMQMLGGRAGGDAGFGGQKPAPMQQQQQPMQQQGGYQQQQGGFQPQQQPMQQQQAPQQGFQPQQQQPAQQQGGGFGQQAPQQPAMNPEPSMDFDDDIPF